jgi:hypothetical protein
MHNTMYYPDSTKPWRSQAEMLDAHQERNTRGEKRYEVDAAFRAACEAKCGLGFDDGTGPSIHGSNATVDSVNGSRPTSLQINFTARDQFEAQERVRLQSEVEQAQAQVARLEPQAAAEERNKALDASVELIKRGGAPQPFADAAEMTRAMSDPRYRRDSDFNAAVAARAALGVPGVTAIVSDDGSQSQQS